MISASHDLLEGSRRFEVVKQLAMALQWSKGKGRGWVQVLMTSVSHDSIGRF